MSTDLRRRISREEFTEQLHTVFTLRSGEVTLSAELDSVVLRGELPRQEQFSLIFRVPADTPVAQWTWEVDHPVLGTQLLLLVPVDRDANGLYLEAAFNRLITAQGEEA